MFDVMHILADGRPRGGATFVLDLSQKLLLSHVAVTIASQNGSYVLEEAGKLGIPTVALDFRSRHRSAVLAITLGQHLRHARRPLVVHAHGARSGLPVAMLPKAVCPVWVYTVHGFHFWEKPWGVRDLAWLAER